jgi:alpha-L-fucosidase
VPPDRRGLIDPADAAVLRNFGAAMRQTFRVDRAAGAKVTASNVRGKNKAFRPENMIEGAASRFWTTDDDAASPEAVFEWKKPETFNIIRLREFIALGQRVEEFKVDVMRERDWEPVATGTTIGPCRILRLPSKITAMKVRLRITKSPAPAAISEFALYSEPV